MARAVTQARRFGHKGTTQSAREVNMFRYHLKVAWRSMRRSPFLTGLMVIAIGLGIGASMTMITVLHVMSGDPMPGLSAKLFVPMMDPRPAGQRAGAGVGQGETLDGFTWADVTNLLRARRADGQAAMASGFAVIRPGRVNLHPFIETGQYVTSGFFPMFNVPFLAGGPWTRDQDRERARVVVLGADLDHKLFGAQGGLGQMIDIDNHDFQVIGVVGDWHPQPAFYKQRGVGLFGPPTELFLPLQTALDLQLGIQGNLSCWQAAGTDAEARVSDHCTWVQFWVRLNDQAAVTTYTRYLDNYWHQQRTYGRFPRADAQPHLYGLMSWLVHEAVIPATLTMQMWLAIGFLVIAMLAVVALLLAKFLRRSGEVSVRRALGARRDDIFMQFGVESAMIGAAGGLLGLLIAQVGLWSVRQRPDGYAHLARMDVPMLLTTVVLAVIASTLAGLLPAWHASRVPPSLQLRDM